MIHVTPDKYTAGYKGFCFVCFVLFLVFLGGVFVVDKVCCVLGIADFGTSF